ncbi:hypothetical protein [Psychroserpens sp.]|uniref:hypothetical protein n=1 Tax=Psychroserpens sp. TaxID=2020870 RepID=UPI001B1E4880|nr:hypothetical protein [Psychroserpens sp.]MBO6607632.1 hypothetical protein [Psychroserpens sp.]MBO6632911.1 hypothetical protein [Psychroserpens sp.]MBO6655056.1 hypothetical protein [Psychroserpens sp.]MBO6683139.1 hypothetical protein [Psychroserpens sp.]MBO6749682.1 hypothetical protein [Psychroserpens sp.]
MELSYLDHTMKSNKTTKYLLIVIFITSLFLMFVKDDLFERQKEYYTEFDIGIIDTSYWFVILGINLTILFVIFITNIKSFGSKTFWKDTFQSILSFLLLLNILVFFFCKELFITGYLYANRQHEEPLITKTYKLTDNNQREFDRTFSSENGETLMLFDLVRIGLMDKTKYKMISTLSPGDTISLDFKTGYFGTLHSPRFNNDQIATGDMK